MPRPAFPQDHLPSAASAVSVEDITGEARDRIYAEQVRRYPGFGEYEKQTEDVRTIPVLALHRSP